MAARSYRSRTHSLAPSGAFHSHSEVGCVPAARILVYLNAQLAKNLIRATSNQAERSLRKRRESLLPKVEGRIWQLQRRCIICGLRIDLANLVDVAFATVPYLNLVHFATAPFAA